MNLNLWPTLLAVVWVSLIAADNFDSVFSVHTERTPYCPPNYKPDSEYVGCCWGEYQTITSAKGPNGAMSPACCYADETCTGAPPIMYDWTTDGQGRMQVITPSLATNPDVATTSDPTGQQGTSSATGGATPSDGGSGSGATTTGEAPGDPGGLSISDKIGLGVGLGVGIPGVLGALAAVWTCCFGTKTRA